MAQNKTQALLIYLGVGFFFLNLFLKLINIQSTPPAATYDEIIYVAEAQSIIKYGTDLTGTWRPWNLKPSDSYYTELTSTVLIPGLILFPKNPILASKFIPLLIGSLLPILLALIAYRLRKKQSVFVITAIIATLNPWVFQFSRMGYDSLFSVGFYSIGIVLILYLKKWHKLWSIIPIFLGFYQYQGHKPLLAPLILICFLYLLFEKYNYKNLIKNTKKLLKDREILASLLVLIFSILLTTIYLIRLPNLSSGERISEFSFFEQDELADTVNKNRRLSLNSPLTLVFTNKYTVLGRVLAHRFLNSFNLDKLFIEGSRAVDTFTVMDYGYFHLIDAIVLAMSVIFLFEKKRDYKVFAFIFSYIIIGTIPNIIRTGSPWIIFRGGFTFLGLIILMGVKASFFINNFKTLNKVLIVLIYALLTTPFFYTYFVRYPITHTTHTSFYQRVVASYVKRNSDKKIIIVPDSAITTFNYLISYNQLLSYENKDQVIQAAYTKIFEINDVKITNNCPVDISDESTETTTLVYLFKEPCEPNNIQSQKTKIKSLVDGGLIFNVYNDKLCSQYELGTYPSIKKNIFNIENLSDQEFCQAFFSEDL
jgi:hypothetical protein